MYSVLVPALAPCNALAGTMALNPDVPNVPPSASPMSARARPTDPVDSLVPPLSLAPFHTSTPLMPAHPEAVVSAAQPETSRFAAVVTVCRARGVSTRPTIEFVPAAPGPAVHPPERVGAV